MEVLHIGTKLCKNGGIENYLINLYRNINYKKIHFSFVLESTLEEDNLEEEVNKLGGTIYDVGASSSILLIILFLFFLPFFNFHFSLFHVSF